MLLRAVATLPDGTVRRCRVAALGSQLAVYAQGPRIAAGIALHPSLARDYGAAHIVLRAAGFGSPRCDAALERARLADAAQGRERLPHRELEQAWLAWLCDGKTPIAGLAERTALGRGIDLVFGKRDDVYALTHALMYATDFGGAALPGLSRSPERIAAEADSALAGALDDDDFDLAGELLLTAPYLRREWSPTASFGFAVLAFVEDEVGVLPSLSLDREGYERHDPASRAAYVTAVAYHTAFVIGAALRRDPPPRGTPLPWPDRNQRRDRRSPDRGAARRSEAAAVADVHTAARSRPACRPDPPSCSMSRSGARQGGSSSGRSSARFISASSSVFRRRR